MCCNIFVVTWLNQPMRIQKCIAQLIPTYGKIQKGCVATCLWILANQDNEVSFSMTGVLHNKTMHCVMILIVQSQREDLIKVGWYNVVMLWNTLKSTNWRCCILHINQWGILHFSLATNGVALVDHMTNSTNENTEICLHFPMATNTWHGPLSWCIVI